MSDQSPSSIKLTPEDEAAILQAGSAAEIQQILRARAQAQNLVAPDRYSGDLLPVKQPTEKARPYPHTAFAKSVTIDGKRLVAEAPTEAEAQAKLDDMVRAAMSQPSPPARDPRTGKFVSRQPAQQQTQQEIEAESLRVYEKTRLEQQFRLGEITAEEYLARTHAVDNYLAARGVDVDELAATGSAAFEQSWVQATEAFLNSPEGADWPGGENMREAIAQVIAEENWIDADDKQAALAEAWKFMKFQKAYSKATTREEMDRALDVYRPSGGMFDVRHS
jgi:hypothetical protein